MKKSAGPSHWTNSRHQIISVTSVATWSTTSEWIEDDKRSVLLELRQVPTSTKHGPFSQSRSVSLSISFLFTDYNYSDYSLDIVTKQSLVCQKKIRKKKSGRPSGHLSKPLLLIKSTTGGFNRARGGGGGVSFGSAGRLNAAPLPPLPDTPGAGSAGGAVLGALSPTPLGPWQPWVPALCRGETQPFKVLGGPFNPLTSWDGTAGMAAGTARAELACSTGALGKLSGGILLARYKATIAGLTHPPAIAQSRKREKGLFAWQHFWGLRA